MLYTGFDEQDPAVHNQNVHQQGKQVMMAEIKYAPQVEIDIVQRGDAYDIGQDDDPDTRTDK